MRKILTILTLCAALMMFQEPCAKGDVGGNVNGPGLCEYPGTGISVAVDPIIGAVGVYYCKFPVEINGSSWVCAYGIYTIGGGVTGTGGLLSAAIQIGGGGGMCNFFCMNGGDDVLHAWHADTPNPPGAWKNEIHPKGCTATTPPILADGSPPPPGMAGPIPPGVEGLEPPGGRHDSPVTDPGLLPTVTDPAAPNPEGQSPGGNK